MSTKKTETPENIEQLADRCLVHVKNKFGFEPDFTSDTLSIMDHFVEAILTEENGGEMPPEVSKVRGTVVELMAPTLGAYFGQMVNNVFGGRWRRTDLDPKNWRFEFDNFFLSFNPVGAAANIILGDSIDSYGATLKTTPGLTEKLNERYEAAPKVDEDDFFTFSNYFESIQIAAEFLLEVSKKDGFMDCSPAQYDKIIGIEVEEKPVS